MHSFIQLNTAQEDLLIQEMSEFMHVRKDVSTYLPINMPDDIGKLPEFKKHVFSQLIMTQTTEAKS